MNVKMSRNQKGSPDGIRVFEYALGQVYDLPQGLAEVFIHEGWAELIEEKNEKKNEKKTIDAYEKKVVEVQERQVIRKYNKKYNKKKKNKQEA